ncbi:MAG: 3-isopropylmalate dehydrogenase [Pyrinomonadaceae bacterium]
MKLKLTVLPGDGIGPEVTAEAIAVLRSVADIFGHEFQFTEKLIGGVAIKEAGSPYPRETREACVASDAVFLGAVGAPEFDNLPAAERPEAGLLALRKSLGAFANLRPSMVYKELADCSPLRPEVIAGADLLIVRELLGGLYFGEPRGFGGERESASEAFNTMRYSVSEIERVAHVAFRAARTRRGQLTSVDKANVLETSQLWRQVVTRVALEYPDVQLDHLYVDACAMHLVMNPGRFDVVLTENLFGDILSDEAAVMTGSLGMLASASVGGEVDLYEPVHGSAPDIANQGIANPLGAICSASMLLRHTGKLEQEAGAVDAAVRQVISEGYRTRDLARGRDGEKIVGTHQMGELIVNALNSIR